MQDVYIDDYQDLDRDKHPKLEQQSGAFSFFVNNTRKLSWAHMFIQKNALIYSNRKNAPWLTIHLQARKTIEGMLQITGTHLLGYNTCFLRFSLLFFVSFSVFIGFFFFSFLIPLGFLFLSQFSLELFLSVLCFLDTLVVNRKYIV